MNTRLSYIVAVFVLIALSCKKVPAEVTLVPEGQTPTYEQEKQAILTALNNETKAAFQRNYDVWQNYWVHDANIIKVYLDFPENTFSESLGWEEIDQFVKTFFGEHPEPEPVPKLLDSINVRLYGDGAWVTYEQQDSLRGRKRETRLMEKMDGQWKIAGMQTTIYGFQE